MRYIDQDTLDQVREALRQGATLDQLAGRLGMSADDLAQLLGLMPAWRNPPAADADASCDLWRADLDDVL